MSKCLQGKIAIVTGAARGIGEGIARDLASKGATVVLNYVSPESKARVEKIMTELDDLHEVPSLAVRADQATVDGPVQLVRETRKAFGDRIDIIVNNAGTCECLLLEDSTAKQFDDHYHLNVRGPMLLVQAALPYLPHDGSGRIINISSISSSIGFPMQTLYGGSKAALDAMTRTWSRELGGRCSVNSISVGPVNTDLAATNPPIFLKYLNPVIDLTPRQNDTGIFLGKGRRGTIEEVAGVVGMLINPDSGWCTGCLIGANGGLIMPH